MHIDNLLLLKTEWKSISIFFWNPERDSAGGGISFEYPITNENRKICLNNGILCIIFLWDKWQFRGMIYSTIMLHVFRGIQLYFLLYFYYTNNMLGIVKQSKSCIWSSQKISWCLVKLAIVIVLWEINHTLGCTYQVWLVITRHTSYNQLFVTCKYINFIGYRILK